MSYLHKAICAILGHRCSYRMPNVVLRSPYGGYAYMGHWGRCQRCSAMVSAEDDTLPEVMPKPQ